MTATKIEWATDVWNPLRGCSPVSEGCRNCYAQRMAHRFSGKGQPYEGLTRLTPSGPTWTGDVRLAPARTIYAPTRWRKPRRIFVNSMSDLFHSAVPHGWREEIFSVMARCPQHTFLILTKRAGELSSFAAAHEIPTNVWCGVSVEDQRSIDERLPTLIRATLYNAFVSIEPLIGPVCGAVGFEHYADYLDWVIVGGESGPKARPMRAEWARRIRDLCADVGTPFFFKQMAKKAEIPSDLMIREFPEEMERRTVRSAARG